MADETTNSAAPTPLKGKSKTDRYVKLGFLAVAIAVVVLLIYNQYIGPRPPGDWRGDLPAAMAQAEKEKRNVVVLVYSRPPSEDYKMMVDITLSRPKNLEFLRKSNDLLVLIAPGDEDPMVKKYGIRTRPTTLLLGPDGREITRREGYMAETDLSDFLKGIAKK